MNEMRRKTRGMQNIIHIYISTQLAGILCASSGPLFNLFTRQRLSHERNSKEKLKEKEARTWEKKSAGADPRKNSSSNTEAAAGITQAERLMEGNLVILPFWCHLFL